MKKGLFLILIVAFFLSACSGPVVVKDPTTTVNPTTTENLGLNKAADYTRLIKIILRAQGSGQFPYGIARNASQQTKETGAADSSTEAAGNDYSQTNIQVEGVDEADIIKTDGRYLYVVANNRFYIVDAVDPTGMKVLHTQTFSMKQNTETEQIIESPVELFLDTGNERLTLIVNGNINTIYEPPEEPIETKPTMTETPEETSSVETKPEETAAAEETSPDLAVSDSAKTMPADKIWYPYYQTKSYTTTYVYDIISKANPVIVRQFTQEGSYQTSRKIEDDLYVVSNRYQYRLYTDNNSDIKPEDVFPCVTNNVAEGEWDLLPPGKIWILPDGDVNNQLIISGIDTLEDSRDPDTVSLIGSSGIVYASATQLYVAGWGMIWDEKKDTLPEYTTDIYRFSLSDSTIRESGKGSVPGSIINQFSMDEYNGYFRLATTGLTVHQSGSQNQTANNLYVLGKDLKIVGQITGLAKDESIQSVRFMGDQAYVVTFRQVDPLFVIDLKNPAAPVVLGQLKIPGYSTYLHPYGDNLLLGFGYDVKVEGESAYTMGLKVSMFDVSDFNNPKEVSTLLLGGRGSYSDLLYNHKSLLFSMEKNLIAFPATLTSKLDGNPMAYAEPSYQGLLVLQVGAANALSLRGAVTHFDPLSDPNGTGTINEKDYTAFYGYDAIYRGAFSGNTLYTFSGRQIRAADLTSLEPMGQVELPGYDEVVNEWFYYGRGIADDLG